MHMQFIHFFLPFSIDIVRFLLSFTWFASSKISIRWAADLQSDLVISVMDFPVFLKKKFHPITIHTHRGLKTNNTLFMEFVIGVPLLTQLSRFFPPGEHTPPYFLESQSWKHAWQRK